MHAATRSKATRPTPPQPRAKHPGTQQSSHGFTVAPQESRGPHSGTGLHVAVRHHRGSDAILVTTANSTPGGPPRSPETASTEDRSGTDKTIKVILSYWPPETGVQPFRQLTGSPRSNRDFVCKTADDHTLTHEIKRGRWLFPLL